uniref:Uncharacterized protein n=1 Tax=Glossina pallidipes TaxID=7398 RepID=A0A1A9ZDR5_GLOPL
MSLNIAVTVNHQLISGLSNESGVHDNNDMKGSDMHHVERVTGGIDIGLELTADDPVNKRLQDNASEDLSNINNIHSISSFLNHIISDSDANNRTLLFDPRTKRRLKALLPINCIAIKVPSTIQGFTYFESVTIQYAGSKTDVYQTTATMSRRRSSFMPFANSPSSGRSSSSLCFVCLLLAAESVDHVVNLSKGKNVYFNLSTNNEIKVTICLPSQQIKLLFNTHQLLSD